MAEKLANNQPQPIVKIGHYTLGQTLGVGTFGKVKSTYLYIYIYDLYDIKTLYTVYIFSYNIITYSWRTCFNKTQGCCEDSESSKNQKPGCCRQNSQGNTES